MILLQGIARAKSAHCQKCVAQLMLQSDWYCLVLRNRHAQLFKKISLFLHLKCAKAVFGPLLQLCHRGAAEAFFVCHMLLGTPP